jgi:Fe-S-cluster containining protein
VKKQHPKIGFTLNGLSIHKLNVNQDGTLEVVFDLPHEQTTAQWHSQLRGIRSFDVYSDKELEEACRRLFQIVRARVEEPDPERLAVHCDRCKTSSCCRKYNVLLKDEDIERLAAGLAISVLELYERYTAPAVDWCGDYARQLTSDTDLDGEEKCVFLKQTAGGRWHCSVYEHRPQICRDFDMNTCDDFVPLEEIAVLGGAAKP